MNDKCCRACATAFHGVCRDRHECLCHYRNRAREKHGGTTYHDPTASHAVGNVDRQRRRRKER